MNGKQTQRLPYYVALPMVLAVATSHGQGEIFSKTLMHDGIHREYKLFVPSGYTTDNSFPLVVNMHGFGSGSSETMQISDMNIVAEREGFLVTYPDAFNKDWFGGEDNVGFIDALTDAIASEYTINQSRLYATGISQGGVMSYVLAAARPDRFAAIAPVAGHRYYLEGNGLELFPPEVPAFPNRVFPLLYILGDADVFVPYNGGTPPPPFDWTVRPVEDLVSDWATLNGGQEPMLPLSFTRLPDIDPNDGTTVDLFSCSDCETYEGVSGEERVAEVLFYRINGGGHNWPGDYQGWPPEWGWAHPVNYDISASTEILNFFSRHELPESVIPAHGDFNNDGFVNGADFLSWQRGESPNPLSQSDLAYWEANYGEAIPLTATSTDVPEPTAALLLVFGVATAACGRRRRRA